MAYWGGAMKRVVLDTNVMVAGLRSIRGASHELLQFLANPIPVVQLGLTTPLLLEYEAVLKRPDLVPKSPQQIDTLLDYWCSIGYLGKVRFRVRPATHDPDDDMVLEAAIAAKCRVIVSHNIQDLFSGCNEYGIVVLTPRQALDEWRMSS